MDSVQTPTLDGSVSRQAVHDLRNLFGVIGAARHLLASDSVTARVLREKLLTAIEEATILGGRLTTDLLRGTLQPLPITVSVGETLHQIEPMMRALVGESVGLEVLVDSSSYLRVARSDLESSILELVVNASRAGAGQILVRQRQRGDKIWITVADDGSGMPRSRLRQVREHADRGQAHGNGLNRVRCFARRADGEVLMRSCSGTGTTIALVLPATLEQERGPQGLPDRVSGPGFQMSPSKSALAAVGRKRTRSVATVPPTLSAVGSAPESELRAELA